MGNKKGDKHKGGPIERKKQEHIIAELRNLIINGKIYHSKYEDYAVMFDTTRQTISKYIDDIYKEIPEEDIQKTFLDFKLVFEKLQKEIDKALTEARTVKERMEVINTYFRLMKEKTDMLERFFKKAREVSASQTLGDKDNKIQVEVIYGSKPIEVKE